MEARDATVRPTTSVLLGAILWALHLAAIYITVSLLVKTGNARHHWIGSMSSEDTLVLLLTLVAAVPTAWVAWAGWRRVTDDDDAVPAFAGEAAALVSLLFLFAIVLEGITVVFLPS